LDVGRDGAGGVHEIREICGACEKFWSTK
jgi:hypothetical protein